MRATIFDGRAAQPFTAADAARREGDAPFAWIDVEAEGPGDADAAALLTSLGLDDFQVAAALRSGLAGTFQPSSDGILVVTWAAEPDQVALVELHIGWRPEVLVTVRFAGSRAVARIQEELARRPAAFAQPASVLGIVLQLLLASVDMRLTELRERLDETDESIIEHPTPQALGELRALRRATAPMSRRFPAYTDTVQTALVDPGALPGMDERGVQHLRAYLAQCTDTLHRLGDLADGLRNAVQDYQTETGAQQGSRIDQLTIVSIIFLPVTFLTGYFGMNFQWLDDQLESFAAWFLLGVLVPVVMLVASVAVLASRGYSLRLSRSRPARGGAAVREPAPAEVASADDAPTTPSTAAPATGSAAGESA